jgi:hypothetical protein
MGRAPAAYNPTAASCELLPLSRSDRIIGWRPTEASPHPAPQPSVGARRRAGHRIIFKGNLVGGGGFLLTVVSVRSLSFEKSFMMAAGQGFCPSQISCTRLSRVVVYAKMYVYARGIMGKLNTARLPTLTTAGTYSDGAGLYVQVCGQRVASVKLV